MGTTDTGAAYARVWAGDRHGARKGACLVSSCNLHLHLFFRADGSLAEHEPVPEMCPTGGVEELEFSLLHPLASEVAHQLEL